MLDAEKHPHNKILLEIIFDTHTDVFKPSNKSVSFNDHYRTFLERTFFLGHLHIGLVCFV